jgi:hypothetical protein
MRRDCPSGRRPSDRERRAAVRCRSRPVRSRHRCASRGTRWHRPAWCATRGRGSPCGRACFPENASMLLCREGHPGKSVGRRPSTDTGPSKRSPAAAHHRRSAPHTGGTRDPAESSAIERIRFGPGSCPIVARSGAALRGQSPFKSRQGKNPLNSQQQKDLPVGRGPLAGH